MALDATTRRLAIDLIIFGQTVQVMVTDAERRDILRAREGHRTANPPAKRGTLSMRFEVDACLPSRVQTLGAHGVSDVAGLALLGCIARKTFHVLPVNDLKPHDEAATCWCHPKVKHVGRNQVVTHNSMDGRELVERHWLQ